MNEFLKKVLILGFIIASCFSLVACEMTKSDNANNSDEKTETVAESIVLSKATLGDVEFDNANTVKIDRNNNVYTVSGTINAMSESQKLAFGLQEVTHVVVLKFTFDKEKTISAFELKGNTTKVFADNSNVENYVGPISDLLDSGDGEDAYTYLVLSANTKSYTLKSTYSDESVSEIKVNINATLATANQD